MVKKHRGVRLLVQDMKVYQRTLEKKLRDIVKINEKQFGFQSGKSSVDAIFVLQKLQEKFGAKKKELFLVFVDLEKAFDHVHCKQFNAPVMRCQKVPEHLITLVMALYCNARSRITSDEFGIGVGVHQVTVSTESPAICGGNAGGNQRDKR